MHRFFVDSCTRNSTESACLDSAIDVIAKNFALTEYTIANIEPEIESSEMQDRGDEDFGCHSLLIHNNNCEGHDESDEDSFDSDDGFCSVDDDASLFNQWEDKEDLDVWNRDGDDSDCELEEDGANDSGAATTSTR